MTIYDKGLLRAMKAAYKDEGYPKKKHAMIALGCGNHTINEWRNGVAPSAANLQRLHELGADVIWILTGRRAK